MLVAGNLSADAPKPNLIVFIADDVSWDDFGCYGNKDVQTPNINKLADGGMKFMNAYLTASSCSPSRNSIMTGRYPHNTGAAELHTHPPDDMISLPTVLQQAGYYTIQAGKFHMGKNIAVGLDVMVTDKKENGHGGEGAWLKTLKKRPKEKPFFAWFASSDAHRGWDSKNQFRGTHKPDEITPSHYLADMPATRQDLCDYYDEIFRLDHYIGLVVEELKAQKVLNNTVIIVMADNGRPFPHSKSRVNDRGMKTPFVVSWPAGIKNSGSVCNSLVSVIDIATTFVELGGGLVPESFQGHNFAKLLDNPNADFRNYIFAEHNWHDFEAHERMVRDKDFMYILNSRPQLNAKGAIDVNNSPSSQDLHKLHAQGKLTGIQGDIFTEPRPSEELYDYSKDPDQLNNVATNVEYSSKLKELRKILKTWMKETGDSVPQKLTKDWYTRFPNSKKTKDYKIRGEMPGASNNAIKNNNKGQF
ncbi:MAG: sulfatase [Planctomycetes bacterium]|nr:sulfatase [Planctomycetota bacterium]